MKLDNERHLRCIHCMRLPYLNDIFIIKVDNNNRLQISSCLNCADGDTRVEKEGGWACCRRDLDAWRVQDIEGEFTLELEPTSPPQQDEDSI